RLGAGRLPKRQAGAEGAGSEFYLTAKTPRAPRRQAAEVNRYLSSWRSWRLGGESSERNMPFHSHKLPNGLQIIGETSPSARSAALGFFVRTGSRDETLDVSGVTHFLEHMVFKGTPRRTALDVNRDFDRIGADYN